MQNLTRRGFDLGPTPISSQTTDLISFWQQGKAIKLSQACASLVSENQHLIEQTESLVNAILEGENAEDLLSESPYAENLDNRFEMLGTSFNEGDDQEVEMVLFDATSGDAEDLWMKVSWLSFHDEDASIRFRFSFGVDLEQDVAADVIRQNAAAELADAVFPESLIITDNQPLKETIKSILQTQDVNFVERIIYFNAPGGGAYLHHDMERGHAGVVYAQLTGATAWLALPQATLVEAISNFIQSNALPDSLSEEQQAHLIELASDKQRLAEELNSFANDALIHLINETAEFVQYLIKLGHAKVLEAGDVILLPQENLEQCCWHSVFCLGEEIGQALSFAIR